MSALGRLQCPTCRESLLRAEGEELRCDSCRSVYAKTNGVWDLRPRDLSRMAVLQGAYYDNEVDEEWEIERPRGAPRFHKWLLREKFARSTLGVPIHGASVLAVCAGSGMDAEFLARAGARAVVAADVSPGAAVRSAERARRHGLPISAVVADAERLPFPDRSFDVVYVHDGLHHLEDVAAGLREMSRVARRALSVTEPARAAATAVAIRLGLAEKREDAGNRVARLTLHEVAHALERDGFQIVCRERYAMVYRHEPGAPMRLLSTPAAFPMARAGVLVANLAIGRFGNKLVVTAIRNGTA